MQIFNDYMILFYCLESFARMCPSFESDTLCSMYSLVPDCSDMSICIYGEKCADNIAFHDYFGLDVSLSNDRTVVTIADDRLNDNDALNDDGLNDDER